MKKEFVRKIVVFGNYFKEFRKTLDRGALSKLYQVLTLIMTEEVVPSKFLKSIKGRKGLYEIRSEYEGNNYRVFCCFDEGSLVILFNGFQKKSQEAPDNQIDKAESLMKQYFELKKQMQHE